MQLERVQSAWFDRLNTLGLRSHYAWLEPLRPSVQRVAVFGCMSSEPFALLWMLDAAEVSVVEIDPANLDQECGPREDYEKLTKMFPESLQGRSVRFIIADMSHPVVELQGGAYDLAYCERVLYHMMPNLQQIQQAINEMARVVRPGGIIIAADEHITSGPAHQQGEPIDISALFEQAGLIRSSLPTIPPHTYCYMRVVDPC